MTNSRITNFAMAVILALWSPGWCCCGMPSGEERPSVCAGRSATNSQQKSVALHSTKSSTRVADLASLSRCCEPSSGGPTSPEDDPSSCGCTALSMQAILATPAALPSSLLIKLVVIDAMAWTLVLDVPLVENYGLRPRNARAGPGLPCAESLFSRNCLLII